MRTISILIAYAAAAAMLAGCGLGGGSLQTGNRDEQRMVHPSDPPTDGAFAAIRGHGDEIMLDDSGEPVAGPPRVVARPIVPSAEDEVWDRPGAVLIEPSGEPPSLPLPPLD